MATRYVPDEIGAGKEGAMRPGLAARLGPCAPVLAGSLALFVANTWRGIGVFTDSTRYMGISPTDFDAPMYHWMLKAGTLLGLSFDLTAMVLALFFLVANVALIYLLIDRATQGSRTALIGTALIAFAPQFVTLHSAAMSEPPFLFFVLLTIHFAQDYLVRRHRMSLVGSALCLAAASLSRFTAPPLGAAIALVILLDRRIPLRRRLTDCILLAVLAGGIFATWIVISQTTSGHSIGRELAFHGNMGPAEWISSAEAIAAWVLPAPIAIMPRFVLVVAVAAIAFWRWALDLVTYRSDLNGANRQAELVLPLIVGIYFVFYLAFVGLSVAIEANLSLNGRYALPGYCMLVMMVAMLAPKLDRDVPVEKVLRVSLAVLAVLMLCGHLTRTTFRSIEIARDGFGYKSRLWQESPTVAAVKSLPPHTSIYSNGPDIIAYVTGHGARFTPQFKQLRTDKPDPGNPVEVQVRKIRDKARNKSVRLVFLDRVTWRFYLVDEAKVVDLLGARLEKSFKDGRIYIVETEQKLGAAPHD